MTWPIRGLYAITDDRITDADVLISQVTQALRGGAAIVQYRDKSQKPYDKTLMARALKSLCAQFGACFLINDDVALALEIDADGVHIGKEDTVYADARKLLGNKIIGVSCYNQLELAQQAASLGADYVAFGRFFPSNIKPDAVQASLQLLSSAKQALNIPIVAIGGITLENASTLIAEGADALALIDGLFGQADIESAARSFARLYS